MEGHFSERKKSKCLCVLNYSDSIQKGGNKMKKVTVIIGLILAMITFMGSVCGAGDKRGYVVTSNIEIAEEFPGTEKMIPVPVAITYLVKMRIH